MRAALFYAQPGLNVNAAEVILYNAAGAARNLQERFVDEVSIFEYMTEAQINDVKNRTNLYTVDGPINAAQSAGVRAIFFPAGDYNFPDGFSFVGYQNVSMRGAGRYATTFKLAGNLCMKSFINVDISNIGFNGQSTDAGTLRSIWVSNFDSVTFFSCYFTNFGGVTGDKDGSVAMYLYAGDVASATVAAGDSKNAKVINCNFAGNGRFTDFGVRVYTEFNTNQNAKNYGALIDSCSFEGYNWNAVEFGGPNTISAKCTNSFAYMCGLAPFDIDKGAQSCTVADCSIYRLLGNIDTYRYPNTRAACAEIQGVDPTQKYANGNTVNNIVAYLLAADIAAYNGRGFTAVGIAYAKNSTVRNVRVVSDAVPARPASSTFAFAQACFETCSGTSVENIETVNATIGIVETSAMNSGVGSDPVKFRRFSNTGTMKGELIVAQASTYDTAKYLFDEINGITDMSDPIDTAKNAVVNLSNANAGNGTAGTYVASRIRASTSNAAAYGVYANVYRMGLDDVKIALAGGQAKFFAVGSGTLRLGVSDLSAGGSGADTGPLDVSVAFVNLPNTCAIYATPMRDAFPMKVGPGTGGGKLYTSATPANPPQAFWSQPCVLDYLTLNSGGYMHLISTGTGWKNAGAIT